MIHSGRHDDRARLEAVTPGVADGARDLLIDDGYRTGDVSGRSAATKRLDRQARPLGSMRDRRRIYAAALIIGGDRSDAAPAFRVSQGLRPDRVAACFPASEERLRFSPPQPVHVGEHRAEPGILEREVVGALERFPLAETVRIVIPRARS